MTDNFISPAIGSDPTPPPEQLQGANWSKFSELPWCPVLHGAVKALEVQIPPRGRPTLFQEFEKETGFWARAAPGGGFVVREGDSSRGVATAVEVLRAAPRLSKNTPHGDALRAWLLLWGWDGVASTPPPEPQEHTRTIT